MSRQHAYTYMLSHCAVNRNVLIYATAYRTLCQCADYSVNGFRFGAKVDQSGLLDEELLKEVTHSQEDSIVVTSGGGGQEYKQRLQQLAGKR